MHELLSILRSKSSSWSPLLNARLFALTCLYLRVIILRFCESNLPFEKANILLFVLSNFVTNEANKPLDLLDLKLERQEIKWINF
mmetsp:Transcript_24661/g.49856  ORF Transcript_24661/g.49856 Transcript_24661/m.49856 type:complete len:85 (+) Transcript_24661:105-359(+)